MPLDCKEYAAWLRGEAEKKHQAAARTWADAALLAKDAADRRADAARIDNAALALEAEAARVEADPSLPRPWPREC